jgi:hypothetical protein
LKTLIRHVVGLQSKLRLPSHSLRRREARRRGRVHIVAGSVILLAVSVLLVRLSPNPAKMPVMTVYFAEGCAECRNWMEHVGARGFRTVLGPASELEAVRARAEIPNALRAPVVGTVDNFVLPGFVPVAEIHRLVQRQLAKSVKGLVVAGTPSGAPGVNRTFPRPFTVYALYSGGMLRPLNIYNDAVHAHPPHTPYGRTSSDTR